MGLLYIMTVWRHDSDINPRSVDVHIGRLRKALSNGAQTDLIRTVLAAMCLMWSERLRVGAASAAPRWVCVPGIGPDERRPGSRGRLSGDDCGEQIDPEDHQVDCALKDGRAAGAERQ